MTIKRQATVPCRWCGAPTTMLGTQECDPCWEFHKHLFTIPTAALRRMLARERPEIFHDVPQGKD